MNDMTASLRLKADASGFVGEVQRSRSEVEKLDRTVDRSGSQAQKAGRDFEQLGGRLRGVGSAALALGAAFAAYKLVQIGRDALTAADSHRLLAARIERATKATGDAVQVQGELTAISLQTGTVLENNVDLFQRMSIGAREFGGTNGEILKVTRAVQQLGLLGGASSAAMTAGTTQFAQAMAAGIVRAEEMNSIIENIPEVAVAIADGMGMTVGELRAAVLEGSVLSEDVFAALLGQTERIADEFADVPNTLNRAGTNMVTNLTQAAEILDRMTGASTALAEGIEKFGRNALVLAQGAEFLAEGGRSIGQRSDRRLSYDLGQGRERLGELDEMIARIAGPDAIAAFETRLSNPETARRLRASATGNRRRLIELLSERQNLQREQTDLLGAAAARRQGPGFDGNPLFDDGRNPFAGTPPPVPNSRPAMPKAIARARDREARELATAFDQARRALDPLGSELAELEDQYKAIQAAAAAGLVEPEVINGLTQAYRLQKLELEGLGERIEDYTSLEQISNDEMAKAAERTAAYTKRRQEARQALSQATDALQEEIAWSQLSERDRQVEIQTRELLNLARGQGLELGEEEIAQLRRLSEEHTDALILADRRRQEVEQAAGAYARIWDQAGRSVQSSLAGAFRNALDGGVTTFESFRDQVLGIVKDMAAQIAAALVFQPILGGIGAAISGGGGSAGGSLLGGLGQNLAGSLVSKILPDFGINAALGGLGSTLFGAAPSVVATNVGSIGAAAAGTSGLVGSGGSLFGLGAAGGPLALGALAAGGLLLGGKLFGDGGVGPNAGARIGFNGDGRAFLKATGADNGGNTGNVVAEANRAIAILNTLADETGGRFDTTGIDISLAIREFAKKGGLQNTADDLVTDILSSGVLRDVDQGTIDEILSEGTEAWLTASATAAQEADRLASAFQSAAAALRGTIEDLTLSDLSPKSAAEQLDIARGTFDALAVQAAEGAPDALQQIGAAGRAFLERSAEFHGTATTNYQSDFSAVIAVIERAARTAEEQAKAAAIEKQPVQEVKDPETTEAIKEQTAVIASLQKTIQQQQAEIAMRDAMNRNPAAAPEAAWESLR